MLVPRTSSIQASQYWRIAEMWRDRNTLSIRDRNWTKETQKHQTKLAVTVGLRVPRVHQNQSLPLLGWKSPGHSNPANCNYTNHSLRLFGQVGFVTKSQIHHLPFTNHSINHRGKSNPYSCVRKNKQGRVNVSRRHKTPAIRETTLAILERDSKTPKSDSHREGGQARRRKSMQEKGGSLHAAYEHDTGREE